ncbi:MAG: DUF456 family protein [Bacillota bacterium]|nr:DUF456 family protein [Bacillota bacterium]
MQLLAWLIIGLGFAGVLLPILPATPLVALGIVWLGYLRGWAGFGPVFWVGFVILAAVSIAADYVVLPWWVKKKGGSNRGSFAAGLGMIVGAFFSLPGLILGPIIAVFVAELTHGHKAEVALRHALNTVVGLLVSASAKFAALIALVLWYVVVA